MHCSILIKEYRIIDFENSVTVGGPEDLPTREDCSGGKGEVSAETCFAVWEELEKERCGKLEQTRRERDQIIIEAYHDKKKKEGKGGKGSDSSTPRKREEPHTALRSESNPDLIASDVADSAKLDTRSLLVRPSSAQRHWSSVSHKQTLSRTPQAKRGEFHCLLNILRRAGRS